jgi:hypothetical protein
MLIFTLLFFLGLGLGLGLGLSVMGLFWIFMGVAKRDRKKVILGILVPTLFWCGFALLWEADRRFIQEETRKNGGQLPDWVW